ncbi:SusC/RagA family TonB-linked outer membrane protein [Capnocytophaga stomatis]|uniref:SusC/RagA family TonB-linked outer membrane protein n=1 Tax=Capnocytophaga stomatis TaxID=1848904 RepID=A0ABW8QBV2_9FLAO
MKEKLIWTVSLFFLALQFAFAQDKTITGTVKDVSGVPLPGVTVMVKGSARGVSTDFDGNYSIKAKNGDILHFLGIGLKSVDKAVSASTSKIDVTMEEEAEQLEEVVVTAMGVSRDEKSLGYATQKVEGDRLSKAGQQNAISALSGNVAGVQVTASSSMGGSTRITIRGVGSVTGDNRPLIVVDGIPMNNSNYNNERNLGSDLGGRDYGDASADINPDDIESVTVLKGGPATALYGSRGGNGVIVYTTKSGKRGKTSVDVKSGITFESTYIAPILQNKYGGGSSTSFPEVEINGRKYSIAQYRVDESWGPKFENQLYLPWYAFDKENFPDDYLKEVPWKASENDVDSFFRTGITTSNSVAVTRSVQATNLRLSASTSKTDGIVPNSHLKKSTLSFNFNSKLSEKFKVDGGLNYVLTNGFNRQDQGYNDNSVSQKFYQWGQRQLDMKKLRDYKLSTGEQRTWNRTAWDDPTPKYSDNPYWIAYENTSEDKRHRFFGNVGLTYSIADNLYAVGNVYGDVYSFRVEEQVAVGSQAESYFKDIVRNSSDFNYEARLHFDPKMGDNFSLNSFVGVSRREARYNYVNGETVGGLLKPNYYNLANSIETPKATNYESWRRTNSVYGMVSLGFKEMLFVEATGRNDWFSTVSKPVFYPSVTGTFIFSSVIKPEWLSFGKVRLGWAQVGNDTGPYRLETYPTVSNPFLGSPRYANPNTANNPNLLPEVKTTQEVGLELKLFKNRVGLDVTYYDTRTKDLILPLTTDPSTGYAYKYINAGSMQNQGIEVSLSATPVKTDNFSWDVTWNFAKNNNKLLELHPQMKVYQLSSFFSSTILNAVEGEPYGQLYTTNYRFHEGTGQPIVGSNGLYAKGKVESLGSVIPDYNMGLNNAFRYKNFDLSVLFDFQKGGKYFSTNHMFGMYSGMLKETAEGDIREQGIVLSGVTADGQPNTIAAKATDWAASHYSGVRAQSVFDATYLKLRNVSLSYTVNLPKNKHVKELVFSAYGRNLWTTGLDYKGIDPEQASYGSGNVQGIETGSLPSTRTYGMSVQIKL